MQKNKPLSREPQQAIRAARLAQHRTQGELAARLEMSQRVVSFLGNRGGNARARASALTGADAP